MRPVRAAACSLLAAAAVVAVGTPDPAAAQPAGKDLPARPAAAITEISNVYKLAGATGGITKADLPKAKAAFEQFAKFFADTVSHPRVHTFPQEFGPVPPPIGSPPSVDKLIAEVNSYLIVPSPVPAYYYPNGSVLYNTSTNRADAGYVREWGAALDKALADVIAKHPERVVRVNAARLLAAACRSGAHAHYPTVTGLIAGKDTDPEVKYYACHAAANLLAAYDLNDPKSRRHSHDPAPVGALLAALQGAVTKSDAFIKPTPVEFVKGDVRPVLPPEMVPPHALIRRQAIKALAQCRFAEFEFEKGKKLYPAYTLALVAVGAVGVESYKIEGDKLEPTKVTTGSPDAIEAVLGICNMTPPAGQKVVQRKYAAAMADVVATGVVTWAGPKKTAPADKSQAWKGTALRLGDALQTWKAIYDPLYVPGQTTDPKIAPPIVYQLADNITTNVVAPLGGTGDLQPARVEEFRTNTLRANPDFSLSPFPDPGAPTLPKR